MLQFQFEWYEYLIENWNIFNIKLISVTGSFLRQSAICCDVIIMLSVSVMHGTFENTEYRTYLYRLWDHLVHPQLIENQSQTLLSRV